MKLGGHLLIAAMVLTACADSRPKPVSVSGSSTVLPVVSRAAETYTAATGQAVIVNSGGSGAGFSQLAEGITDIGMMSRDITAAERGQYPSLRFMPIAIAKDAVVPVVSSEIYKDGVRALTLEQIAQIYRGDITNWRQVGGPDREILVVDKEASRGTRHIFMKTVLGNSEAEAPGADLVLGSNNEEQTAITQSDSAIGMLSMAWLNDDVRGLSLKMPGGVLVPATRQSIARGDYPITRDLVVIARADINPSASAFVDYLISEEGQVAVEAAGYIALTSHSAP